MTTARKLENFSAKAAISSSILQLRLRRIDKTRAVLPRDGFYNFRRSLFEIGSDDFRVALWRHLPLGFASVHNQRAAAPRRVAGFHVVQNVADHPRLRQIEL